MVLPLLLGGGPEIFGGQYSDKVLGTAPDNLIGYWPMGEASGTTATDLSPQGNDGSYTGVTLGEAGIGDGRTCPLFDGVNDYNDVYSAALNTDFNGAEGSFSAWLKVKNSGVWTDASFDVGPKLAADGSNIVQIYKKNDNNTMVFNRGGGATNQSIEATISSTAWFHVALTWSEANDEFIAYLDGSQTGITQTGLGTWSGALDSTLCLFGAEDTTPSLDWNGWGAHWAVWTTPLTAAQISNLAKV